jgi:hypothetical protein
MNIILLNVYNILSLLPLVFNLKGILAQMGYLMFKGINSLGKIFYNDINIIYLNKINKITFYGSQAPE